jgi:large subunit ribosomal protein L30
MAKLKITLVKSPIGSTKRQKATLEALGLRKMHHSVEQEDSKVILGMVNKLRHLLKVEEVE